MTVDPQLNLVILCIGCRTSCGGHESNPPAAAAAELWALGAEGAAGHWRLWERHKMEKHGLTHF